jgi:outer membrane protein TolC
MQGRKISGVLILSLGTLTAWAQQLSGGVSSLSLSTSGSSPSLDQLLPPATESPYTGSVVAAAPQPGVIDLTVQDAIDRGLKYNLGIIVSTQNTAAARAERLKELSNLLPQINGTLRESYIKTNLQALGISFNVPGAPPLPKAVTVANSDARVTASQKLIDLHALQNTRAASANVRAAGFDYNSARETVTLAVAASYLLVLSAESQVETIAAELRTAEALQQLAIDRENAGLSPNIDTLRARVELQVRRQQLIEANNSLAKQRITLLRTVGLPVQQQVRLATKIPYKPLPPIDEAGLLTRALASRPDYLAAEQQVKAAELRVKAAQAERIPSLGLNGDFGALGTRPGNAISTWNVSAELKVPIFQGGKIEADIRQADADLRRRRAERDNLRGRIEQDIADALLDVRAAAEQLEVAHTTLDYARLALTQSQDRFSAGVTNNIEVIQAQEALSTADQQHIASLYSHNIAKVLLARALGEAEKLVREALAEETATGGVDLQSTPAPQAPGNLPTQQPPANAAPINPAPSK